MGCNNEEKPLLFDRSSSDSLNGKLKSINSIDVPIKEKKHLTSALSAGWNVSNIIQGIGILGIPFANLKGSWVSIFLNIYAAFTCCSTGKMIVDCLYEKNEQFDIKIRVCDDYPEIGERVWPKFGRWFVLVVSLIEMFGASTLYVILLGSSSHTLFEKLLPNLTQQHWFLICCSLVIFMLFVKQLSIISWFSFIAVIALLGTTFSTIIYCFTKYEDIKLENIPRISIQDLPISMGIIVFSYCAHPLMPSIEASMRKPKQFHTMLNVSFTAAMVVKIIFGVIPVLIFGESTSQSIVDNLSIQSYGFYLSTHIFVLINVFFSMPLVVFMLSAKLDEIFLVNHFHHVFWPDGKFHYLWLFVTRFIVLSSILLTGLVVPYFALVMSFIGSFTGTCLSFIFPCWFSLVLKSKELNRVEKLYRIAIIVFGTFVGANGMIFAAKEMYTISHS